MTRGARSRGPLARCGLHALSWIYAGGLAAHRALYASGLRRAARLDAPVISVGNLVAGGTGKTPLVEWLVRRLRELGRRPGVLTRGYRAAGGMADEAALLADNLPELPLGVGAHRADHGRALLADGKADCFVLDDGFQHRALARDLDIVLLAAEDPWGGGALLPAGWLREPIRGLARAGAVGITGEASPVSAMELRARIAALAPGAAVFEARRRPLGWHALDRRDGAVRELGPPDWAAGREVFAFSGLAAPDRFIATLESLGAKLRDRVDFADHHAYDTADLEDLYDRASGKQLVTTQKDAVKLRRLAALGAWTLVDEAAPDIAVLRIGMEVGAGREGLERALADAISG